MEIIGTIIVIWLLYLLIRYVIIPVVKFAAKGATIVMGILGVLAATAGVILAIFSYVKAFKEYLNPYMAPTDAEIRDPTDIYTDHSRHRQENAARRSYFFGPGYYAVFHTIKAAFQINIGFAVEAWEFVSDIESFWLKIPAIVLAVIFSIVVCGVGTAVVLSCSLVHFALIMVMMIMVYLVFSLIWLVDQIYLRIRSIRALCPHCKRRYVVPTFACSCGRKHDRLIPSAYGILSHKCVCGARLPTTFFGGRSGLEAFCPHCDEPLASSDARQYGLSVIGGSSSGKTMYLASFFHEIHDYLKCNAPASVRIPDIHTQDFEELEDLYYGRIPQSSTRTSDATKAYSLVLEGASLRSNVQYSMFDVAGEIFDSTDLQGMAYTADMRDSDGILLMVDPFSSPEMQKYAEEENAELHNVSQINTANVVNNFANYLRVLSKTPMDMRIRKPIAVILTKADYACLRKKLSHYAIGQQIRSKPEGTPAIDMQDEYCRRFLVENGFADAVTALEANFMTIHYFLVSASGGAENGEEFDPDAFVMQPVQWLIRMTYEELADAMGLPDTETILRGAYGI